MTYKLIFSPEFLDGLMDIEFYLREFESDKRAEKVLNSIEKEIERIVLHPFEYQQYEMLEHPDIYTRRAVVHRTYIIVFHIVEASIYVLRIYHGKQNIV